MIQLLRWYLGIVSAVVDEAVNYLDYKIDGKVHPAFREPYDWEEEA